MKKKTLKEIMAEKIVPRSQQKKEDKFACKDGTREHKKDRYGKCSICGKVFPVSFK